MNNEIVWLSQPGDHWPTYAEVVQTTLQQYINWEGTTVTLRTFTIELRVDYDDKSKDELIKKAAVEAAKHLFTTALLISDKRKPLIGVSGSDFFAGKEEIDLMHGVEEIT